MKDASIVPLQQLYLSAIIAVANADKLTAVQQELGQDSGRLWLTPEGTTKPLAMVAYRFELDSVAIGVQLRQNEGPHLERNVAYVEGLDKFLEEFDRHLKAGRLAAPKVSLAKQQAARAVKAPVLAG